MSDGRNKQQSRENRARVRQIMLEIWDPIGVGHMPEARDEYDGYVGAVYVMLMDQRASAGEISDWLYSQATGHMGLLPSLPLRMRSRQAAEALVMQRPSFETH